MADWTNYGYLSEGARTNLIFQSEDFDTTWTKVSGVTVTTNTDVAPDGTLTADTILDVAGASFRNFRSNTIAVSTSTDYVASLFVKKDDVPKTTRFMLMRMFFDTGSTHFADIAFDTSTGEFGYNAGKTPDDIGVIDHDTYWRIWVMKSSGLSTNLYIDVYPSVGAGSDLGVDSSSATTDGGNGPVVWGAQVEEAAFPSSYIPTTTTAETRAADNLVATIGTLDSPCTIAVEFRTGNGGIDTETIIQADDDSAGIDHSIRISRTAGDIIALIETATATVATLNCGALANNTVGKVVVTCADGAFNATLFDADDAVVAQATPDTSGTAPTGMTKLRYGVDHTPANWLYGHVTTVRTWDTAEIAYLSEWPEFDPAVIGSMGGNNTVVYGPSSTPAGTISLPQLKRIHAKVQSDLARVSARPDLHRALKSRKGRRR